MTTGIKSYLPRSAQTKKVKRPVVGMCRRCGEEFFTKRDFKLHIPRIGCGK